MAVTRNSALFLIILFIAGLSGCGKTGPLYLPDKNLESGANSSQK